MRPARVLHLEDSALDAELVSEYLAGDGLHCEIERVWARAEFTAALRDHRFDLIVADHQLPGFDGDAALDIARDVAPGTPFIFVSGTLGEEVAVEALKRGATDYVVKQRLERLAPVARRALSEAAERDQRARAQEKLRASETNFATLVDAMPQLCWMADAGGYITWYNRRWYAYTGTTPAEMEGWGWQKVHDPDTLPRVLERWRASIATGEPFEMVFPLRGADGRFRPFLTRVEPVKDEGGAVLRWLGTNTDVSAQHEAEDALRRVNEELEDRVASAIAERERALAQLSELQKMETIGQLTGGVAHDFNNLLTPIIGNLDLLARRLDDEPKTRRLLDGAAQAADRAKTLVQRLLAFARRQVLETGAVDVAALVAGLSDLLSRSLGPQVALAVEAPPGLPPAHVDPNQLELAILNLAVNARDAMNGSGGLSIVLDVQSVGADHSAALRHGDYLRVSVIDTGEGMDAATLRRAIEPFFSTKGVGKGTGLGLSMVHGLAAQSGGALLLFSTPGAGTRAEIWLPVAQDLPAGAAAAVQRCGEPGAVAPAEILVVDDEDLVRSASADMLRECGHTVAEARSGQEALNLLHGGSMPELVITDYLMAGMTGLELAAKIKQLPRPPAVLMATGYAQLAGHQVADLPMILKPFRQSELLGRVAAILEECRSA